MVGLVAAFAQVPYTPFVTQSFPGYNPAVFLTNGPPNGSGSYGLTATTGGSLISNRVSTDGTSKYEIRTTYRLIQSGGHYVTYFRATANALLVPNSGIPPTGTFYALELSNAQITTTSCSALLQLWKVVNGQMTSLAGMSIACRDGMTLRIAARNDFIHIYNPETITVGLIFVWENSLASGFTGVGAHLSQPSQGGISNVQVFPFERVPPPAPAVPGVSAFDTRVEMPGGADAGTGLFHYNIYRKGPSDPAFVFISHTHSPEYADIAVAPSTAYQYQIASVDFNENGAFGPIFAVQTAPAGSSDPRQIGLRNSSVHWGGAGEQIDMQSGNLNLTVPLLTAQARSGLSATFALNYNTQMWRKDALPSGQAIWKYGRDMGMGLVGDCSRGRSLRCIRGFLR
ncbi:MAG: hypothetical protein WKF37_11780 [Bryobacteraceae bacterium]